MIKRNGGKHPSPMSMYDYGCFFVMQTGEIKGKSSLFTWTEPCLHLEDIIVTNLRYLMLLAWHATVCLSISLKKRGKALSSSVTALKVMRCTLPSEKKWGGCRTVITGAHAGHSGMQPEAVSWGRIPKVYRISSLKCYLEFCFERLDFSEMEWARCKSYMTNDSDRMFYTFWD